jgi:uncharacterized protein YhfF
MTSISKKEVILTIFEKSEKQKSAEEGTGDNSVTEYEADDKYRKKGDVRLAN